MTCNWRNVFFSHGQEFHACVLGEKNDEKIRRQRRWETRSGRIPKVIQQERNHRDITTTDTHQLLQIHGSEEKGGQKGKWVWGWRPARKCWAEPELSTRQRHQDTDWGTQGVAGWVTKGVQVVPGNTFFCGKMWHPFTPLAGLVFIKRPGVGGYDKLLVDYWLL